jgi:hypothetical protein
MLPVDCFNENDNKKNENEANPWIWQPTEHIAAILSVTTLNYSSYRILSTKK